MIPLSICIATYKRAKFIGETLESILAQLPPEVELLIVDGNSPDETEAVVATFFGRHPLLRYVREQVNSGVDADYDKAVAYARGQFCWLMTDDDILLPGAVETVLDRIRADPALDLLVVNAEVRNVDLTRVLEPRLLEVSGDRRYREGQAAAMLGDLGKHLKFIGCVVVRRARWMARERVPYYGSLFIHVGAIFQSPPLEECQLIASPQVAIRYGNAMWTARGFEIWMFLWPKLVWSFSALPPQARARVSSPEPWRSFTKLGMHRATGGYTPDEYRRHFGGRRLGQRILPWVVATMPASWANAMASAYCILLFRSARLNMYDLLRSPSSNGFTRLAAKLMGVG